MSWTEAYETPIVDNGGPGSGRRGSRLFARQQSEIAHRATDHALEYGGKANHQYAYEAHTHAAKLHKALGNTATFVKHQKEANYHQSQIGSGG